MKLLTMTSPQCLLYSAAMVLDVEPDTLINEIGHDGLEVWWPQFDDYRQYRSHNMQEIIDCFLRRGKGLAPIDACPMQSPDGSALLARETYVDGPARFMATIKGQRAILIGWTHAWAWDGEDVYDPRGYFDVIDNLQLKSAWMMLPSV